MSDALGQTSAWTAAVQAYSTAMLSEGHARGTLRLRRTYIACLAQRHPDPWAVTTADLQAFLAVEEWAPATRKSARAALRSFFSWAYVTGLAPADPSSSLKSVRIARPDPRPAPETVIEAAIQSAAPREELMIRLATFAGLRAREIASVHEQDWDGRSLIVHGKGGKVRTVPIVEPTLIEGLNRVRGYAFPNSTGQAMTPGHVSRVVSKVLPDGWTAHKLRHRFATQAYAGERDLLAVRDLLGHEWVNTTQGYVRPPDDALRAAVQHAAALAGARPESTCSTAGVDLLVEPLLCEVRSPDVALCATVLADVEELLSVADPAATAQLGRHGVAGMIAIRAAAAAERHGDLEVFRTIMTGIDEGWISTDPELVECRTASCPERRSSTLDYAGVTCPGCGRPRSRVLGPVSEPDCPTWCHTHAVDNPESVLHARELPEIHPEFGLEVWLRTRYDESAGLRTSAPEFVVRGSEGYTGIPLTAEALDALERAIAAARRLL